MNYSGTHLLLKVEEDLGNYSDWVVSTLLPSVEINEDTTMLYFGAGIGTLSKLFFEATGLKPDCVEIDPEQREIIEDRGV